MKTSNYFATHQVIKYSMIIFGIAFAMRLIFLWQYQSVLLFSNPIVDLAYHHEWAKAIAQGQEYYSGPFFRAPLYPLFLGAVYALLGDNPWIIRIIQAIIGSLSAVLVFLIGVRAFNLKTGLLAGLITAAYGTLIFYDGQLLVPSLAIFLTLVSIYILTKATESKAAIHFFFGGLFLGMSAIARPTVLLFALLFLLWVLWRNLKTRWLINYKILLLYTVGLFIPILPVTIYNYIASNEFILIGAYGGINFYIGNYSQSDGVSPILPNTRRDWWGGKEDTKRIAEMDVGHKLSEAAQSRYWLKRTMMEITDNPAGFIKLLTRKLILLLEGNELSNNFDLYYFAHQTVLMKLLIWRNIIFFPWGIILPLAICGMLLAVPFSPQKQLAALFLLAYLPAVVLFLVTARYRLPMAPMLILFASFGIISFIQNRHKLSWIKIISTITILIFFLIICNSDWYGYGKKSNSRGYHTTATIYSSHGNKSKAEKYYRLALAENRYLPETCNDLALLLSSKGNNEEALSILQQCLKVNPTDVMLKYNLGYIYLELNKPQQAIPYFESVIQTIPDYLYALNNLGLAYLRTEHYDSARYWFKQSLHSDPQFINGYYNLGLAYSYSGKPDSARYYFNKTIQLNGSEADAYYHLGFIWLELGNKDSSITNLRSYLKHANSKSPKRQQVEYLLDSLTTKQR